MKFSLRLLYLYLFSFVGLLITVIGGIQIVDLTLKTYVFKVDEYSYVPEKIYPASPESTMTPAEQEKVLSDEREFRIKEQVNQRKRQLSNSLSMIAIGVPLYLYHWKTIKRENKNS